MTCCSRRYIGRKSDALNPDDIMFFIILTVCLLVLSSLFRTCCRNWRYSLGWTEVTRSRSLTAALLFSDCPRDELRNELVSSQALNRPRSSVIINVTRTVVNSVDKSRRVLAAYTLCTVWLGPGRGVPSAARSCLMIRLLSKCFDKWWVFFRNKYYRLT